jgi:peptidoglycan/LPS O-acetylase OafA/YrhL
LPYLPALDGLRAIAVVAVLFYHAEMPWMPGGFLGVEVFFVISGYLITGLLLAEWRKTGRINLPQFWLRRARRLLPAVFALLIAALAFAVVFLPTEVASLRGDALAAAFYVSNWWQVFSHKSYFEAIGRPSLLRHLWSLAVEEQFYVVWPVLLALVLRWLHPRRMALLAVLAVAGAIASSLWMAYLYHPDVDPSRVYYGTDTRAAGFLIGAALAMLLSPGVSAAKAGRARWLWAVLGVLSLVGLGACFVLLDEINPFLYLGGFALVSLLSVIAITAVVYPGTPLLPAVLGQRVLKWIGLRSYSIYLWHWPIFAVTRPFIDVPLQGIELLALRFGVTLVLAEVSYRFIERPIRDGALGRLWARLRVAQGLRAGIQWASLAGVTLAVMIPLTVSVVAARPPEVPAEYADEAPTNVALAASATRPVLFTATPAPTRLLATPSTATATVAKTAAGTTLPAGATAELTQTANATSDTGGAVIDPVTATPQPTPVGPVATPVAGQSYRIVAIGDSVMRGAAKELQKALGTVEVDAVVSRQAGAAINDLKARRDLGTLGDIVIVHIGSNGYFTARQFDEMLQVLSGVRQVLIVNIRVPRRWESPNNAVFAEGVKRVQNTIVVDWYSATATHPDYFVADGVHLQPAGQRLYASLILSQLYALNLAPPGSTPPETSTPIPTAQP